MDTPSRRVPSVYVLLLAVFTTLFIGRVAGQLLVAFFGVRWLPAMEHWYSGLLPYPYLVPTQIAIIALMLKIVHDFWRGVGFFVGPKPRAAIYIRWFSYVYVLSMVLRYVITMWLHPELRWFAHTIPIWFHIILAAFLYTYSHYHIHFGLPKYQPEPR